MMCILLDLGTLQEESPKAHTKLTPPPFNMSEGTDCLHKRVMRIIAKLELKTCDHDHQHMISLICPFAASSAKFLTWPSFKYFDCD